jgi:hypothetical protein
MNARQHGRAARRRDKDQGFHCCLPLGGLMLGFRQLRDVIAGVLQRDKLATARHRYRIVKPTFPAAARSRINGRCGG